MPVPGQLALGELSRATCTAGASSTSVLAAAGEILLANQSSSFLRTSSGLRPATLNGTPMAANEVAQFDSATWTSLYWRSMSAGTSLGLAAFGDRPSTARALWIVSF